jgi:hypothetical protein
MPSKFVTDLPQKIPSSRDVLVALDTSRLHRRDKLRCWGPRLTCSSCQAKRAPLAERYIRAFRVWHYGKLAGPELIYGFRGSMAALQAPLSTLRRAFRLYRLWLVLPE